MQKTNFTATLPATRCTAEMRSDVQAVADAVGVDKADVIRDALDAFLPQVKLNLGLIDLDDVEAGPEEQHQAMVAELTGKEDRSAGCFGGPPLQG